MRRLLPLLVLACAACNTGQPRADDVEGLAHVELIGPPASGSVRIYYTQDIEEQDAKSLVPHVAAICSEVGARLGFAPPRAELVIYEPAGPEGARGKHVRETRGDLVQEDTGWRIRFVYPWRDTRQAVSQLLGTTAHEVAEATVLLRVTVIDPYLRWLHDGIAVLIEHEVLARLRPKSARESLGRTRQFVRERREDGVRFVDLTRWRQLAPYLVRSHRFLGPGQANLDLANLPESLRRVRNAMMGTDDPLFLEGLQELETALKRTQRFSSAPAVPGAARPDDPLTQDFLFYNAAFALWLSLERAHPGVVQRTLSGMAERREQDDHVLSAEEAQDLVRFAAEGRELPNIEQFSLEEIEAVLLEEEQRLR